MGKQYISTAAIGLAHNSDIYDVAVCDRYTISCSSDGYLKFWDNKAEDVETASKNKLVDKLGLHHVCALELDTGDSRTVLIATIAFNGKCYLYNYSSQTDELTSIEAPELVGDSYWAVHMQADADQSTVYLALSTASGQTCVLTVQDSAITGLRKTDSAEKSFATAVCIDPTTREVAVGHQNGTVYLYDLSAYRLVHTFSPFGVRSDESDSQSSLSTVRKIAFSPDGGLIAVARDSGSYGIVALYDHRFGETIGTFTVPTHTSNVSVGGYTHEGWCFALDFNEDGSLLVSGGYDDKIRIWNVDSREKESTITLSKTDVADAAVEEESQSEVLITSAVKFLKKGMRAGAGGSTNEGIVVVGFDRAIRWYREAGGI